MVYVLLCLLLALLCSAEDAPRQQLQQEEEERRLERIRPTYHRVLRDAYGAEWSDAEIDDYLYRIVVAARLARPEAVVAVATTSLLPPSATEGTAQRSAMKPPPPPLDATPAAQPASMQSDELLRCQPRLHVFSVTHFHPRLPGQQRTIYRPSCVALHRCSADAGCCHEHHACVAAETRNVTLGFVQVTASGHGGADEDMVYLTFENHTECHCHSNASRAPQRCVCPWPYVPAESRGQSRAPRRHRGCDCVCPNATAAADGDGDAGDDIQRRQQQTSTRVSTCADVSNGRRALPWPLSRNNDMSKSHYRACAASSVAETSTRASASTSAQQPLPLVRCGLPACAAGGAFSFTSWSCPAVTEAAAAAGPSDGQSESEASIRSTSQPAETTPHSLRRRNRQRDSESGAAAATTPPRPPPPQLQAAVDRASARGSVHWAFGVGDDLDSAGGRDGAPRTPHGSMNERHFIAHRCADRSCSSASTRLDNDRQQEQERQHGHGHSNLVERGDDDVGRSEQQPQHPIRHHDHQLSENADMKLLAWTRPGVVLERGGSSARTKLGRELWAAAESLWTTGQGSRGGDGGIGGRSTTALVVCPALSSVVVTVEPGSSVSCSLHEPSHKYLVRTARGNLLCGANGGGG